MKNKILLILIITILNGYSFSQERKSPQFFKNDLPELIPYCIDSYEGKWGYCNTKTKEFYYPELSAEINKEFEQLYLTSSKSKPDFDIKEEGGYYYVVDSKGNKKSIYSIERNSIFKGIGEGWACFNKGRTYKYVDCNAKVVLEVEGYNALPFQEGRAVYCKETKYGYIDKNGKVVTSLKFEYAKDFSCGLAPVKIKNNWGYIDTTGKVVIPPIYNEANTFINGLAYVKYDYNSYGYIDVFGNEYFPRELIPFKKGNLWGFFIYTDYEQSKQKVVIPPKYHSVSKNLDRTFIVSFNDKYGVLNSVGKEMISPEYDNIWKEGKYFRLVKKSDKYKYGILDNRFNLILESIYDEIVFDCNMDGKIDEKDNGFILRKDNKLGFYNFEGKEILPFICDVSMGLRLENDLLYIKVNEKKGLVDLNGNILIQPKYDDFAFFSEGCASYKRDGKWGHLNKNGNEIIPPTYDDRYYFYEGLAKVKKEDKYGFIDYNGKVIIPFIYDEAKGFEDGIARVNKNNKYGYIDKKGEVVVPIVYDDIENFYFGFAAVKKNSLWGFVDRSGKEVIAPSFSYVQSFNNPYITVVKSGGKYGIIDNKGKFIFKPEFDAVNCYFKDNKFMILSFSKEGKTIYYRVEENSYCISDKYGNCK